MAINKINYKGTEFNITNNIYSPEEVVVGVYVRDDGIEVPLYRKKQELENIEATSTKMTWDISNLDKVIKQEFTVITSNNDIISGNTKESTTEIYIKSYTSDTEVSTWITTNLACTWGCFTIEYTKTTDVEVAE